MSSRIVTGAFLVGVLAVSPALAQERHARQRSEQSGDRGGDRGGNRGSSRSADRGDRGGDRGQSPRVYQRSTERAPQQRAYEGRQYQQQRRNDAPRQYTAPQARRYDTPRRYEAPRANQYDRRTYSNRGYAAPRRDPSYRGNSYRSNSYRSNSYGGYNSRSYNSRSYGSRNYSYSRRYVYGGYRGVYGYGSGYRRSRIVTVVPWRPYHYRPRFSIGVYYGAGGSYDYGYTPSYFYDPLPGHAYGGVRITEAPRDAQVFADGYYVGIVDDFDGVFQHVNLEPGQHRIEVRTAEVEPISFDVYVQPGRTITLRADDYNDGFYDDSASGDGY
ncbi:MAG: hypothetical protein ABIT71_18550 [Vicinamibacteraceae bacterium]